MPQNLTISCSKNNKVKMDDLMRWRDVNYHRTSPWRSEEKRMVELEKAVKIGEEVWC